MCLGSSSTSLVQGASLLEVRELDLPQKELAQVSSAIDAASTSAKSSESGGEDFSLLSDSTDSLPCQTGDDLQEALATPVEETFNEEQKSPTNELQRIHQKCTAKWRRLSAQRRRHPLKAEAVNAQDEVLTSRPQAVTPVAVGDLQGSRRPPSRTNLDALRQRHAMCIGALKTTKARQEAESRATEASKAVIMAEILKRTNQIQESQDELRQNLDLRAHYNCLKATNEALLAELDSCRRENKDLHEKLAALSKRSESKSAVAAATRAVEDDEQSSGDVSLGPMSGLSLMSPYASWARRITY